MTSVSNVIYYTADDNRLTRLASTVAYRQGRGRMEIKEEKRGDVKIIGLRGRLDAETSPSVEKRLMNLMDQGERRLVFDFSELTYISSSGLRVLIGVARNLQKTNGKAALAALSDYVHEIIKIAGFTSIFSIYPTCDEAVAHSQSDSRCEDKASIPPGGSISGGPVRS